MTRPLDHSPEELEDAMEDARIQFERWRQVRRATRRRDGEEDRVMTSRNLERLINHEGEE